MNVLLTERRLLRAGVKSAAGVSVEVQNKRTRLNVCDACGHLNPSVLHRDRSTHFFGRC
ncbi:MAG TPA: hypothetical protein VGN95_00585 [Pyrinomonadaceae bacterium]|jgi:hypothetical protein|nr:hypothetical protein [Pyrinomonadaceae bacterium]